MRAGAALPPRGLGNLLYPEDSHLHPLYGNDNLRFTTSQGGKMTDLRDANFNGAMSLQVPMLESSASPSASKCDFIWKGNFCQCC